MTLRFSGYDTKLGDFRHDVLIVRIWQIRSLLFCIW
ncbi:hypothetical protein LCGC14_0488480 [marine sediment metagenome]|uniref:Uncharacterized protein n=1 Tax=marine sediment metagenome TaxID=412755 RepID=A0A0F9UU55_9ZZZZ